MTRISSQSFAGSRRRERRPCGFTLVEIVLAMAMVTFGIVAVVSLIGTGLRLNRESQNEVLASLLARDYFSKLNTPYAWDAGAVMSSELRHLLGTGNSLETFAPAGTTPAVHQTYFDSNRRVVGANDPDTLLVLESEIGPAAFALTGANAALKPEGLQPSAIDSMTGAANMVWVRFTITFPKATQRSQQFATLITQPPAQ